MPEIARRALPAAAFRQNRFLVAATVMVDSSAVTARRGPGGVPRVSELAPDAAARITSIAQAREQRKGSWGDPYEDAELNRWVCTYATPVIVEETVRGVVAVTIPADQTLLRGVRPGPPERDGGPDRPPRPPRFRELATRPA